MSLGRGIYEDKDTNYTKESEIPNFNKLYVAPLNLRSKFLSLIKNTVRNHKKDGGGLIFVKLNALVEAC